MTMTRAIRIYAPGPPSVMHVEEISVGPPTIGHVRMRQEAIGINFVDTMVRDGSFTVQLPTILGFEGAGVVEQLGKDVDTLSVGDRVGYFFSAGAYAGERLIDAGSLIRLPSDITTEQAAVFLCKGLTRMDVPSIAPRASARRGGAGPRRVRQRRLDPDAMGQSPGRHGGRGRRIGG
jgi:NADPH2:quinone reductase